METDRFEALIDAILAIIITIIVLEIPLPASGSWDALYALRYDFLIYAASFIVCFNFWNYNNNLFSIVNKIDAKVIWSMGVTLLIFSLLPYLTIFVGENFFLFFPQLMYGLCFIVTAILSTLIGKFLIEADPGNIALHLALSKHYPMYSTLVLVSVGIIIGYFIYPPAIIASCIISILGLWLLPKIQYYFRWEVHFKCKYLRGSYFLNRNKYLLYFINYRLNNNILNFDSLICKPGTFLFETKKSEKNPDLLATKSITITQ